jgi:hypothetical protein
MRKIFFLIAIFSGFSSFAMPFVPETVQPLISTTPPTQPLRIIASLKIKDIQKLTGRKLTLKEKIAVLLLKRKIRQHANDDTQPGKTALIIAIVGLGLLLLGLLVPYLIFGSLVAAIIAIVLGSSAKKVNPSDTKAHSAVLIGWITLGLIALLLLLVALIIASWAWYW